MRKRNINKQIWLDIKEDELLKRKRLEDNKIKAEQENKKNKDKRIEFRI